MKNSFRRYGIRFFDILFAFSGLVGLLPLIVVIVTALLIVDGRPVIFSQVRVGKNNKNFVIYKFRTLPRSTDNVATHMLEAVNLSRVSLFLRSSKLDEVPQLLNVLLGEMSLVGPRPCLPTQTELINQRMANSIDSALPGITGYAQVNNVDMSNPSRLVQYDKKTVVDLNFSSYFRLLLLTVVGRGGGDVFNAK